ncbi:sensor histidine kinase [Pedobacter sp. MC2016-15]|uniref:sensor histidine kinase n=1 Tax=Pedobacter sp. MC2016-15 TaxID=2994473 RepID=UPI0022476A0A|nr:sensor histidine kinase [Pedobacter sp. MC2016-15]MCX2480650.1 sensor histidine kinase [Pedobacter sp. MC2016-15]
MMISIKRSLALLHLIAWLIFLTIPVIFMTQNGRSDIFQIATSSRYLLFSSIYIFVFYLHTEILVPKLFLQQKYTAYWLALLLLLFAIVLIKPFDQLVSQNRMDNRPQPHEMPPPPPPGRSHFEGLPRPGIERAIPGRFPAMQLDITAIFIFVMMIGLGSAMRSMKQWQLSEKRALLAEAEKATAELSFLKAQINPHFLYNTLNNIYTLCITGSEHAAESVMKLSKIMRYVTDESEADFVPLQDEIDCISNYISLQQLRLGKKVTLNYTIAGDVANRLITPLVFMTFIENAFKYGLSNHQETQIDISITMEKSRVILLTQNPVFADRAAKERRGIGIANTKKRLEYLYPGSHDLQISSDNGIFKVALILEDK